MVSIEKLIAISYKWFEWNQIITNERVPKSCWSHRPPVWSLDNGPFYCVASLCPMVCSLELVGAHDVALRSSNAALSGISLGNFHGRQHHGAYVGSTGNLGSVIYSVYKNIIKTSCIFI